MMIKYYSIIAQLLILIVVPQSHQRDNPDDLVTNYMNYVKSRRNQRQAVNPTDPCAMLNPFGSSFMWAAICSKPSIAPLSYEIPGPFEPVPGRSPNGNYVPLFPFSNQYSMGLDLDPSLSRHFAGDINVPVPSWGMIDINGRFFNRISDTTSKVGYHSMPVNMFQLNTDEFLQLLTDPSLAVNRESQPLLPIAALPRAYVPMSCRPPLCNPYTQSFGLGIEHDAGGSDGVEGDLDVPVPISKNLAYRYAISGNVHYDFDNLTISYGSNMNVIDPIKMHTSQFDGVPTAYEGENHPRIRRSIDGYPDVVANQNYYFMQPPPMMMMMIQLEPDDDGA